MDLASDIINLILVNLHKKHFIHFLNNLFNYIHKPLFLWGPLPLGLKFKCLALKFKHINWGCYMHKCTK